MIWLGPKRGYFTDWITQRWVQATGRRIDLAADAWLSGPVAPTSGIGPDYFTTFAKSEGCVIHAFNKGAGVLPRFGALASANFDASAVHRTVAQFYERTAAYELDAWAEWCGLFRPFGWLLAVLFSRRLQQLNVPLSGLDTSQGMTNEVLEFFDSVTGALRHTAWYRRLPGTGNILYAGFYSVCTLPGRADPCVKVVFPLPNGNAIVIMGAESRPDGSLVVTSAGDRFGQPGFYFTVHGDRGTAWARYVRALRESIHVFPAENGVLRANHVLTFVGATFLRLHYRMRYSGNFAEPGASPNGGPAQRLGNSGVGGGPPSVS